MTKFFSSKFYKMFVVFNILNVLYVFYNQQEKLNSYVQDKNYYQSQVEDLKAYHEELLEKKENLDSPEYIEEMAREKLDMYLPNERVYIDMSK